MSPNDDPTLWDEHASAPAAGDDVGEYFAERPVNLREQKLRPAAADGSGLRLRPPRDGVQSGRGPGDRYGVGADALAEVSLSAEDLEALREEQLRRVLGRPPGVDADPARWGWRGKANALGARLKPDDAEVAHRRDIERIRQPLPGTPVIAVVNPKGGSGVTPATVLLAAIFGRHRGHGVVAWDNHESRGTLATRAAAAVKNPATTWDLLAHAGELCSPTVVASALGRFLITQPTGEEILASDQSSKRREMIGAEECAAILAVLRRHRTMVVIDTGNNERAEAFVWAVEHATQLVIPLAYRRDAAHMVLRTLDGLAARGHGELVRSAVVVLAEGTAAEPAARDAVHEALARAEITRVLHVPFDTDLAGGERIVYPRLAETTVRAWTRVAAVVADGIADVLAHSEPQLRTDFVPQSRDTPAEFDVRFGPRPAPGPRPATDGGWVSRRGGGEYPAAGQHEGFRRAGEAAG
ncbi:MinD/ParA family ATP-binding protein [Nocardia asiatica]|uniref:MinD/ParA family ATP-binding protein n=1 Tax=Nocardia asiatica TaxID=209252 RepID=UPI00245906A4|nr:ParA family protein [Nocardia asiatica]